MNPIQWLEEKIPGFAQLREDERLAIQHFVLLWSLFEGKALRSRASAQEILSAVHNGFASCAMELAPYQACLAYFRDRYFSSGTSTHRFNQLNLRRNDNCPLVEQVLRGENNDPADVVAVVLIVIYRFRNNLFHGVKWEYELRDQLDNFNHANRVLMAAYDQLLS